MKSRYTFGSPMPTRTWSDPNSKYKYGFNGKEKDNEVTVDGGDYDFGARIYDSRLGRWLACDPLQIKYPELSTYSFCANSPIKLIDPDGKQIEIRVIQNGESVLIATVTKEGIIYNAEQINNTEGQKYVQDFLTAKEYLSKSAMAKDAFDRVIDADKTISLIKSNIIEGSDAASFTATTTNYDKNNNTTGDLSLAVTATLEKGEINWNPNCSLIDGQFNVHSPAMGLMGEIIHADNAIQNPLEYQNRVADEFPKNDPRDNKEELLVHGTKVNEVIKEIENAFIGPIQPGTVNDGHTDGNKYRSDHSGTHIEVKSVTTVALHK